MWVARCDGFITCFSVAYWNITQTYILIFSQWNYQNIDLEQYVADGLYIILGLSLMNTIFGRYTDLLSHNWNVHYYWKIFKNKNFILKCNKIKKKRNGFNIMTSWFDDVMKIGAWRYAAKIFSIYCAMRNSVQPRGRCMCI